MELQVLVVPDCELRYRLVMPAASPSNNVLRGLHFQAYRKVRKAWQEEINVALNGRLPKAPLHKSFLRIQRACEGSGLDWDNILGGLKPLIDCLVVPSKRNPDGLGLIENDDLAHMPYQPYVTQVTAPSKKPSTTIEIFEILTPINQPL